MPSSRGDFLDDDEGEDAVAAGAAAAVPDDVDGVVGAIGRLPTTSNN